ncbi:MAG: AAA family ATPase [Planctomycetota bacterium]
MQRVMVVGCGGAGKSTLAKRIAACTGLPIIHLDTHFWSPGWVETPPEEWAKRVAALAARDRWVIDGNYSSSIDLRFARADTVVFLDFPRWRCLARVVKRLWQYHGRTRSDMREGCPERLTMQFLRYVWHYRATRRARMLGWLNEFGRQGATHVLSSPRDVSAFVSELEARFVSREDRC